MFLYIPIIAIIHMSRGAGRLPRYLFFPLIFLICYLLSERWQFAALWMLGWIFYQIWGMNFSIITRRYEDVETPKIKLIDIASAWIAVHIADPLLEQSKIPLVFGFAWQTIRGLFLAPALLCLGIAYHNIDGMLLYGLLLPLHGICYYLGGVPREHKYSVRIAEGLVGCLFGLIIVLTYRDIFL